MSRCFPFPPPGFVSSTALIDSIELQKERKEKKEKKEKREKKRKTETSAGETRKKEGKKHKDKKRKHDDKSQIDLKAGDPASAGEGSGTTEEQGLPAVQFVHISPDDAQDNIKRRKVENIDDSSNSQGSGLRIRLPLAKVKESTPAAKRQVEEQSAPSNRVGHTSLTSSQSQASAVVIGDHLPPGLIAQKLLKQPQPLRHRETPVLTSGHLNPPSEFIRPSRHLNPPSEFIRPSEPLIPARRESQPPAAINRQVKRPSEGSIQPEMPSRIAKRPGHPSKPTIKNLEIPPPIGKHPEIQIPVVRQQNYPSTVANQGEFPLKTVRQSKETNVPTSQRPELPHVVPKHSDLQIPSINQKKQLTHSLDCSNPPQPVSEKPCISGRTEASLQQEKKATVPIARHAKMQLASDQPSFSGRREAASQKDALPSSKKLQASLGFSGSSSSRRKEATFRDLIENWTPPQLQMDLPQDDELDWLSVPESSHYPKSNTGCGAGSETPVAGQSSLASWPPRARHLLEAEIHVLPYIVPF